MKRRLHYACIGYEAGLLLAVVLHLLTEWPLSALNVLGFFGTITSVSIAAYQGKVPPLKDIEHSLQLCD
jgi:hypothetical protein